MGLNGFRISRKGEGSYSERYVIFKGVVANMLLSVTGGWVGPKNGTKMRYVFYGRPLMSVLSNLQSTNA